MKLSRNLSCQQAFTEHGTGLVEAVVFLGPAFYGARFEAAGAVGDHAEFQLRGTMDRIGGMFSVFAVALLSIALIGTALVRAEDPPAGHALRPETASAHESPRQIGWLLFLGFRKRARWAALLA